MNNTMILISISLLLGLIGTFTKTSRETKEGKKKVTVWGYFVALLLIISALTGIINQVNAERSNRINKENQLAESQQQRLLSMLAVSSNFDIASDPYLNLAFYDQYTKDGILLDSAKSAGYNLFPGFGVKDVSYTLEMHISDSKYATIEGAWKEDGDMEPYESPNTELTDSIKEDSDQADNNPEGAADTLGLHFVKEPINNEMNYLWMFSGYKSVSEILLDLQAGREIGYLTFKKTGGQISEKELKQISAYIKDYGSWIIRGFIKNKNIKSTLLHLAVPVKISGPEKTEAGYQFILVTGQPQLGNYQFSPI